MIHKGMKTLRVFAPRRGTPLTLGQNRGQVPQRDENPMD
jgi:hypothetical protein